MTWNYFFLIILQLNNYLCLCIDQQTIKHLDGRFTKYTWVSDSLLLSPNNHLCPEILLVKSITKQFIYI